MATRFYLSSSAANPVTPPAASGADWEHIDTTYNRALVRADDSSSLTTRGVTPDAADHLVNADTMMCQAVSAPLVAQTISGNLTAQIQCLEANAGNNLYLTMKALVISNDGSTVRATLMAITRSTSAELATSLTNRTFPSTALTNYTCESGDRICVEIGGGGTPTAALGVQGHNLSIRLGTNASSGDLPVDESTTTNTYRSWIEFSNTLTFGTQPPRSMHQFRLRRQ